VAAGGAGDVGGSSAARAAARLLTNRQARSPLVAHPIPLLPPYPDRSIAHRQRAAHTEPRADASLEPPWLRPCCKRSACSSCCARPRWSTRSTSTRRWRPRTRRCVGKKRARAILPLPPSPSSLCQPSTRQPPPFPRSIPRVHRPPTGPGARARRGRHGHEEPVPEGESSISAATPALRRRLAPALTPLAPKKTTPFPQDKKRRHILVTTLADAKVELKGPSWVLVT